MMLVKEISRRPARRIRMTLLPIGNPHTDDMTIISSGMAPFSVVSRCSNVPAQVFAQPASYRYREILAQGTDPLINRGGDRRRD
jgi:hypothetical protein